jgi:hypothetical protein
LFDQSKNVLFDHNMKRMKEQSMQSSSCGFPYRVFLLLLLMELLFGSSLGYDTAVQTHQDQRLSSSSVLEATTQEQPQQQSPTMTIEYKQRLPRIEVQLLCKHDIRQQQQQQQQHQEPTNEDSFNVSETFHQFYKEVFFDGVTASNDTTRTASTIVDFETEVFTFVSVSDVHDVKPSEDYYAACNQSSSTVLATMDIRGYAHITAVVSAAEVGETVHPRSLFDNIDQTAVKAFFQKHVCSHVGTKDDSAVEYFKAKIRDWDVDLAPPPPKASYPYPYPSTKDKRHFNHNLRLLCDGGVDVVYPNYHKSKYHFVLTAEHISAIVVGIVVGCIMICMIYTELQKKDSPHDRQRQQIIQQQQHSAPRPRRDDYHETSQEEAPAEVV